MRRALLLAVVAAVVGAGSCAGAGAGRLLCYTDNPSNEGYGDCTHLVYTGQARGEKLEELLGEFKKYNPRIKTLIRINDDDQTNLRAITKSKLVQGLEISDAHRTLNRTKVQETVESARTALSTSGGGPLYLSLPPHPELLAKYYDLRSLVKIADLMVVETHDLGAVNKMTYHPSRLSGMWDMMNTDSVVDLVIGLGVPASKLIISLPATAQQFTLANETLSTPGSPAKDDHPKAIDQAELCRLLQKGKWTLERDQDLSAPYAFKDKTWIAFEDPSSIDVKGKYARVRGLAGLALQHADRDAETPCGLSLKNALAKVLNQQSRAPRAAVLRSLEQEILSAPAYGRSLDALQVSPYRITQVVDSDGVIHSIREDTRTEFSCSRQGYFVHPRSCGRFYRCVKFDQLSPDYTVFEFDCPAGLAFDSRHEVCVWPGSLPGEACPGSSEIAPVPKARFVCPAHEGYYADPENCRWFFACLDHGLPALSAYEFRCPFGLGFDEVNLKCDWPWLVPGCGHVGRYEAQTFGFSGALLTGAAGYSGQSADAINIAAHQSLASGAALTNHVGLQHGLLASDALDANFITSQQAAQGLAQHSIGLVQPTNYKEEKYTSGSLILDEYRLPKSKTVSAYATNNFAGGYNTQYAKAATYSDNSGAYVHDPSGDYAEPYKHINSPAVPYLHEDSKYNEYQDYGLYTDSNEGKYASDSSGAYVHDNSGAYRGDASFASDSYKADYSGAYNADYTGKYVAGVYQSGSASYNDKSASSKYYGSYGSASNGGYLADSKVYTGASHALTAGAVNVGFVGKTTLVETPYIAQENYQQQDIGYKAASAHSFDTNHGYQANVQSYVSQPAVSITHVGTDSHNLDGYEYATTPTTSGIPTTATPFAVTTPAVPTVTYKTTFLPEPPKTDVKQVFYSQPAVTYVQPTVVPVTKYVPKVEVTDYNQAIDHQVYESKTNVQNVAVKHESSGYVYDKPSIKFEEGVTTYTTPAPAIEVSTYKPQSISHATVHQSAAVDFEYARPLAVEEPFKKVVAYTTGPSYVTEPSVPTYSQSISHQTVHNVNSANIAYAQAEEASVHQYSNQEVAYEAPKAQVNYVTVQPPVTSTYTPQVYNEQTVHEVDINRVNTYHADNSGYQYSKPVQTGYQYDKPVEQFVEAPKPVQVSSVPVYKPQSYSQQTVHTYQQQSQVPVTSTPQPKIQLYQQPSVTIQTGYQYNKPVEQIVEAPKPVQVSSVPVYKPQSYSQQTVHTYQQQSQEPVISTPQPKIQLYKQPAVTIYENPILKYTQKEVEPITYVKPTAQIYSQTYQPIVQKQVEYEKPVQYVQQQTYNLNQGYNYNQPEIQRNVEVFNTVKYSQANEVSHQVFHQLNTKVQHETQKNNFVTVTTSPATLAYEDHYVEYETPKKVETYKAPEYVPPKTVYQESYVSSTPSTPLVHNSYVSQTQDQFDYKGVEYAQQYELSQKAIPQVSFTTTHQEPKKVESYHISSYPGSTVATIHQSPEIQVGYQEYLPPAVSYKPVTSTYRPTVSTTKEYLPPTPDYNDREYLPPNVENTYSPSTTAKTLVEINFKNQEYLPPQETYVPVSTTSKPIVRYEYNAPDYLPPKVETTYLPPSTTPREYLPPSSPREYLPPSTTPREYLPPSTSPREYLPPSTTPREYLPPSTTPREYLPPSTTARPVTSTTPSTTTYKYVESTTFKAPEYLPPQEEDEHVVSYDTFGLKNDYTASSKIKYNPYQIFTDDEEVVVSTTKAPVTRKQNIVVEHAKSNLLGFGTVGPDAGLVSPVTYTTYGPVSSTESYTARPKFATSTYPSTQGLIEVTPTSVPARRVKPKVAVVTKINDYNPLLVRKLGAVCSCQAPVVVLRGRRPSIQKQSDYDYSAEYDDSYERGDVEEITRKVERIRPGRVKTVTSTTFNPIIVPDDSYYDDYVEPIEVSSKKAYSENYISTTPAYSTTEQIIKIRPRVKSVTVAPTYKTVILDSASTAAPIVKAAAPRGRDELLSGIECQRAGLFRHPKHCNKFYACRWDCDKQRFTLHTFNCPIQLSFDPSLGACNWPSQGPACQGDTLLSNTL